MIIGKNVQHSIKVRIKCKERSLSDCLDFSKQQNLRHIFNGWSLGQKDEEN